MDSVVALIYNIIQERAKGAAKLDVRTCTKKPPVERHEAGVQPVLSEESGHPDRVPAAAAAKGHHALQHSRKLNFSKVFNLIRINENLQKNIEKMYFGHNTSPSTPKHFE